VWLEDGRAGYWQRDGDRIERDLSPDALELPPVARRSS
jgi:hypothetical protein